MLDSFDGVDLVLARLSFKNAIDFSVVCAQQSLPLSSRPRFSVQLESSGVVSQFSSLGFDNSIFDPDVSKQCCRTRMLLHRFLGEYQALVDNFLNEIYDDVEECLDYDWPLAFFESLVYMFKQYFTHFASSSTPRVFNVFELDL